MRGMSHTDREKTIRTKPRGIAMNILVENVSVELLRGQRAKLLDFLNPSEEIQGLINMLDHMLDKAEDAE